HAFYQLVERSGDANRLDLGDALIGLDDAAGALDLLEHELQERLLVVERAAFFTLDQQKLDRAFERCQRITQIVRELLREASERHQLLDLLVFPLTCTKDFTQRGQGDGEQRANGQCE